MFYRRCVRYTIAVVHLEHRGRALPISKLVHALLVDAVFLEIVRTDARHRRPFVDARKRIVQVHLNSFAVERPTERRSVLVRVKGLV